MAGRTTTPRDLPAMPGATVPEPAPDDLDVSYLESLVASAGGEEVLAAEGVESDYVQPVEVEDLLGAAALDEAVTTVLAIRDDHLEAFWGLDNAAFQAAVSGFIADRPFLTVDDAVRAVLRRFGVRAKVIPPHLEIVEWHAEGWQLVEIDMEALSRSRPI